MTRGVDLSRLSPAERRVAAAGAVLFLNGFVPWWYRIRTPGRTYLHNAGLGGWGLIAVLAGFAVVVFAAAHAGGRAHRRKGDWVVYLASGAVALGALGVQASRPASEWIGYWIGVAAALAIMTAAVQRLAERRSGWV